MENIIDFVIDIDISDRELLYDYGHEQYYTRPEGGWDLNILRVESELDNEAEQKRSTRLMDIALTRWGCLESDITKHWNKEEQKTKKVSDSTYNALLWHSTSKEPSLPKRIMPVYRPGETVRGTVRLELKEDMEANKLILTLKGAARILMKLSTKNGDVEGYGSEKYMEEEEMLWKKKRGGSGKHLFDQASLLSAGGDASDGSTKLGAGIIRRPFLFNIPNDARASCPPLASTESDIAHILYRLKAIIDRGNCYKRGNIVCGHAVWVHRDCDIAAIPDALTPAIVEETMTTGILRSGMVKCRAVLPQKAFVRMETLPLMIYVENLHSVAITSVSAYIKLGGLARTHTSIVTDAFSISCKSDKVLNEPIPANSTCELKMLLPLTFPQMADHLIPTGTMEDCKLIKIHYKVVIKLKRKLPSRDLELKLPISIGTMNSSSM